MIRKKPDIASGFFCCGGRIRTCDLQVMSLASYQLLHSAMFIVLRVQRYCFLSNYANFIASFFVFLVAFPNLADSLVEILSVLQFDDDGARGY